jgi:DNA mismatch endonuclease (patch repair protein)
LFLAWPQCCKFFVIPKTRTEWWKEKIEKTVIRDQFAAISLKKLGWNTITIWECELKPDKRISNLNKLYISIKGMKIG